MHSVGRGLPRAARSATLGLACLALGAGGRMARRRLISAAVSRPGFVGAPVLRLGRVRLGRVRLGRVRVMLGVAAPALTLVSFVGVIAAPAYAHAVLASTEPKAGSTVGTVPTSVTLRFTEPVRVDFSQVAVLDQRGEAHEAGPPDVLDATVTQAVAGLRPGLEHTVSYRVVSADWHPVSGSLRFRVAADADAAPDAAAGAPSAQPSGQAGSPSDGAAASADPTSAGAAPVADGFEPLVAVFGVLAAAIGLAAYVLSRRRPRVPGPGRP